MILLSNLFASLRPLRAAKPVEPERLSLPAEWLPEAPMKRIHVHWTAGGYIASSLDREHYHFLVEGDTDIIRGHHLVTANIPPLREGKYAAHTYHANAYSIGIGICAMNGATSNPLAFGRAPIKKEQWDKTIELIAALARHYNIPVTDKTILTHAEVQPNLNIRQRGKWDIAVLPFWRKKLSAREVGDKMRSEVAALV